MKKKRIILLVITLSGFLAECETQNSKSKSHSAIAFDPISQQNELRYLKEVLWPKAYREQDTLLLDRILDESFELIDGSGNRFTKDNELKWIKENATQHDSFGYEIKRLHIYKNRTSVIAGTGHIYKDSTHSTYESSNVLIYQDSTWKAILSHVSGYKIINNNKDGNK